MATPADGHSETPGNPASDGAGAAATSNGGDGAPDGGDGSGATEPSYPQVAIEDIPPDRLMEYRQIFSDLDDDDSGEIDSSEMQKCFVDFGIELSEDEFAKIIDELDEDGSGSIDFAEFATCMHGLIVRASTEAEGEVDNVDYDHEEEEEEEPKWYSSWPTFKHALWLVVERPSSSLLARVWSTTIMMLILVSVVTFLVESLPDFHQRHQDVFGSIELVCVLFFSLEYVLRFAVRENKWWQFLIDPLNLIDLVAIAPFYFDTFLQIDAASGSSLLRSARLVRVFRLFKISRYLSWLTVFFKTLQSSLAPLAMIIFVMSISVVFFASGMYYLERGSWSDEQGVYVGSDGRPTGFESIPKTFYFILITMSTVGYGDVTPVTPVGQLTAGFISLSGVLILAIPIAAISANFNMEYAKMERSQNIVSKQESKVAAAAQRELEAGVTHISKERETELDNEAFLESAMELVMDNGRRTMKHMSQREVRNRQAAQADMADFVEDMRLDLDDFTLQVAERAAAAGMAMFVSNEELRLIRRRVNRLYDVNAPRAQQSPFMYSDKPTPS